MHTPKHLHTAMSPNMTSPIPRETRHRGAGCANPGVTQSMRARLKAVHPLSLRTEHHSPRPVKLQCNPQRPLHRKTETETETETESRGVSSGKTRGSSTLERGMPTPVHPDPTGPWVHGCTAHSVQAHHCRGRLPHHHLPVYKSKSVKPTITYTHTHTTAPNATPRHPQVSGPCAIAGE